LNEIRGRDCYLINNAEGHKLQISRL